MITRRDALVGLLAMPAAIGAFAAAPDQQPILGPTVFHWEDMKPVKTNVGEVHISTLNPGLMSHPPHRHVNEELIILRDGECETLSDGKWVKITPGSVVFNASNSLHGFRNVGATPATYHVINWSPNKDMAAKK
jgi:quercetin dioxygenase-like cupin family protein